MTTGRDRDEQGMITAMVAVLAVALVAVVGMVYDGGQIVAAQATARDVAGNAARAGAQHLDVTALRASGDAVLDPDEAAAAARAYLAKSGHSGEVQVDGASVTVTARVHQPMRILPVPDRVVAATDTATAVTESQEEAEHA